MKIFGFGSNTLGRDYHAVCDSKSTRSGFRHEAVLFHRGNQIASAKCHYLNRTWEAYPYESVLYDVVEKADIPENVRKSMLKQVRTCNGKYPDPQKKVRKV